MTKKDFKEMCSFHEYTGYKDGHKTKHLAIFFDWKDPSYEEIESGNARRGFKFGVAVDAKEFKMTKAMLLTEFYDWVTGKVQQPSWCIRTKYAIDDAHRFKTPLSLNW